jgi:hypothetical protein
MLSKNLLFSYCSEDLYLHQLTDIYIYLILVYLMEWNYKVIESTFLLTASIKKCIGMKKW